MGRRKQYSLRHVGSSTINKQLGNTIKCKCAIECSKSSSPFCKEQVVVGLSRTCCSQDTIIVGNKQWAINRFWSLICRRNQWTDYIDTLLNRISVNGTDESDIASTFNYADNYPYRPCDITLPNDDTGYVYMLVSCRDFDRDYIGQTENISRRFDEHRSGRGSKGTANPYYHPYAVAAYICGMSHMGTREREHFECRWKQKNIHQINNGNTDLMTRIEQGRSLVTFYNQNCQDAEKHIRFVVTIRREVATFQEPSE